MIPAVIKTLITIVIIVALVWLGLWVVASIGLTLPAIVVTIIWVLVVLICILVAYTQLKASPLGEYLP